MKSFRYVIKDELGIHARPAGDLVREIQKFDSDCTMSGNGKSVDGKKLMKVMILGIKQGQEVELSFTGADEEEAAAAVEQYMKENI